MIIARTSEDFCHQGLTLYADHNLGSWVIQSLLLYDEVFERPPYPRCSQ